MVESFRHGNFSFLVVETEHEINFIIVDSEGYVCRLIPGYSGFDLSPLDLALGNLRGLPLIAKLSDHIVRRYA